MLITFESRQVNSIKERPYDFNLDCWFFPVEEAEVGVLTARKERTATTSYKEPYKATTDTEKETATLYC